MLPIDFRPFACAFCEASESDNSLTFITLHEEKEIRGYNREIIKIARHCNGQLTVSEIRALVPFIADDVFDEVMAVLVSHGLVVDSRMLYSVFHIASSYPLVASHDLSPADIAKLSDAPRKVVDGPRINLRYSENAFDRLLLKRKSTRCFTENALSEEQLAGVLRATYRIDKKSVPSAGGLYPLEIFLLLLKRVGNIVPGCYRYCPETQTLIPLSCLATNDVAAFLLDSSSITHNATAVLFVAADMQRTANKYANRGYRYVLLEAGHAAQNAYLYCAEEDIGIVEYGGFNDEEVAQHFGLVLPQRAPVIALVVGTPDHQASRWFAEEYVDAEWRLRHTLVGKDLPIEWLVQRTYRLKDYVMPRYVAWAKYRAPNPSSPKVIDRYSKGFGMGASLAEATVKALAEAFERYASGLLRVDRRAKETELDGSVLDLCQIAPLPAEYLSRTNLRERSQDVQWEWVAGSRRNGDKVYVPVDQVFYPLYRKNLKRLPAYQANSTGVAAHYDLDQAILNAVLELIERDAIATFWYARRPPPHVASTSIPEDVQTRVLALRKYGHKTIFLDLTIDTVPVIMCFIMSSVYPHIVSGAAASLECDIAIQKSFNEAEFMLHSWRKARRHALVPEQVYSNIDHGVFYFHPQSKKYIEWFLSGARGISVSNRIFTAAELIERVNPVIIDLTPRENRSGLCVVKVLSEELIPLLFGYGGEHRRHPRLRMLGLQWAWDFPSPVHPLA